MVRWLRWHCPPDTRFEIRALAVWGRARYLSVTEAPHNTDFHTWMGKKHFFCFFQTAETGNWTPSSGVKGSGANHYPRAPALYWMKMIWCVLKIKENCHVLVNQFHGNFRSKTLDCMKIKSVFRDVKCYFNALWGVKGLKTNWIQGWSGIFSK